MKSLTRLAALGALSCVLGRASTADAFCGFYVSGADAKLFNHATQVVVMREGQRTVLSMQNNYQGPPENFALVVPVPVVLQKESVKTLPREIFAHVDQLAAPRLVEYWERDPCSPEPEYESMGAIGFAGGGAMPKRSARGAADLGVTVEAQFTVGEYEVVILSAKDSTGLDTWLKQEKYKIPDGAEPYLRPYVQQGSKFFVAKVDVKKLTFSGGQAMLSPLRFHYDVEKFSLPVRLGLMNANGPQDLIVHVLAKGQRYDAANLANVTIPTNIDIDESAKERFGEFYAALFDRTVEKNPKAIITEYAWDSSTCDPCPGPTLTLDELATLGADVLPGAEPSGPGAPPMPTGGTPRRGRAWRGPAGFTISRLHARYTKESLGEDIVFKAAEPIVGGREFVQSGGKLEEGSRRDSINNFQGRYAIRHPWKGAIACPNPARGRWGGPPDGATPKPRAAQNLAFAPRGKLELASFVKKDVPEIGLKTSSPLFPASPSSGDSGTAAAPPSGAPSHAASAAAAPSAPPAKSGSCSASPTGKLGDGATLFAGLAAALAALRVRTRSGNPRGRQRREVSK